MADKAKILKVNGLSRGVNGYQVLSYLILIAKTVVFSVFLIPNFITIIQILVSIPYYLASILLIFFGYKTTVIDPTDELVFTQRRCKLEDKPFDESEYSFQCDYCETSVHRDSKHCRVCDRPFMATIVCLAFSTLLFAIFGFLLALDYYTKALGITRSITIEKNDFSDEWKIILVAVFTGVSLIICALDFRLILFHIYLIKNNMTTYDFILREREKMDATLKQNNQKPSKHSLRKTVPITIKQPKDEDNDLRKVQNQTPDIDEEVNKEDLEKNERQITERAESPETRLSLQSGINTRRESKAINSMEKPPENAETYKGSGNLLKPEIRNNSPSNFDIEQTAPPGTSSESRNDQKWKFKVFQNENTLNRYNKLTPTSPTVDSSKYMKNSEDGAGGVRPLLSKNTPTTTSRETFISNSTP